MQVLQQIRQMGSSNAVFNQLYKNNPNFKQFADQVRDKTPEQAFSEHGLDFSQFRNLKW